MRFNQFVLKNIFRRRVRSALTMIGMAVAVGAVVALVGISDGFKRSFTEIYDRRKVDLIIAQAGQLNPLNGVLPDALGPKVAALPGVAKVAPGLTHMHSFTDMGIYGVLVQGWPGDSYMLQELDVIGGERLSDKYVGKHAVMLGKDLAARMKKKVGDKLALDEDNEFQVVGIYDSFSMLERGFVIMFLEDLQKYAGKKGQVTGCTVVLKQGANLEQVRHKIETDIAAELKVRGQIRAMPAAEYANQSVQLQAAKAMAWLTSVIALFIGAVGMLNTMIMSVFERTREIGILRAIGWRPARIVRMILTESVLLSLAGGVVGTASAIFLTYLLSKAPAVNGLIRSEVSPAIITLGFAFAVVVGLIGAAYPAYRGARLMPTEAIRHE